jgi:histidinol phosphatase-like PHP family hydrolase
MRTHISRRRFLNATFAAGALSAVAGTFGKGSSLASTVDSLDFPLVDYHVHLDQTVTLEKALQLSQERRVKFGIVEHAGTKANLYPGLLSTDEDLKRYLAKLEGKPVYKGIQAEGLDWTVCFSKSVVAQLDYVLSDALTFPDKNGQRIELWRPGVKFEDPQDFMERYTDFNVQVMAREPLDILANPTFLPASLEPAFNALWTVERMKKVIRAAVQYQVAIEINSRYRLPRMNFLKMAQAAGAKFSLGSNIHGVDVGKLDYCIEAAKQLGLTRKDIFTPAPSGKKPIEIRRFA